MGKLIIDGTAFFEIDEECLKKKRIPPTCDLEKYFQIEETKQEKKKSMNVGKLQ